MTRARATALVLVNWKGVFYERYELDRHVTALEGANGAGKTTVMIGAYIVLLPDMARLRFTNVGETGATGGDRGIWGRLGESGRPSYAVMELELGDGARIAAGVHLERKGEPSVVPTPFLVTGLPSAARLSELLLLRQGELDAVPDLKELKANAGRLGAAIEVFPTARDYFVALFERGVTPLRLTTDEERNKLNEMLRASMTGGISRALTTELRSFLMKEETGLSDTLGRMRANLDACSRTRIEVGEAKRLEHEIAAIYDAGQAMFAAHVLGVRERAAELGRRVEGAVASFEEAKGRLRELDAAAHDASARRRVTAERLAATRARAEDAAARREVLSRALSTAASLSEIEPALATAIERAEAARSAQGRAAAERAMRSEDRDRAREAYDRCAIGLADLQKGLEELHRAAHAGRHARRRMEEARAALGEPDLDVAGVPAELARLAERRERLDAERARRDRARDAAQIRRDEWQRALAALSSIAGEEVRAAPHERARGELSRLAALELEAARLAPLTQARTESLALAARQRAVRERASALGLGSASADAPSELTRELASLERDLRAAEAEAYAAQLSARDARLAGRAGLDRERALEDRAARYRALAVTVAKLEGTFGAVERSREGLAALRRRLADDRHQAKQSGIDLERRREQLLADASGLEAAHGGFHPELLGLCEELEAELLASRFEDVDVEEAATMEARLGPLSQALIVEDPAATALALAGKARDLGELWFVDGAASTAAAKESVELGRAGGDVVVASGQGVRLSRVPTRPTLGRRARERRVAELLDQAVGTTAALEQEEQRLRQLDAATRDVDALLADVAALAAGDPEPELAGVRTDLERIRAAEADAELARDVADERARGLRGRIDGVRSLWADAALLGPPDHTARARELLPEIERAASARDTLARASEPRKALLGLLDALAAPPPSDEELLAWAAERAALEEERDRLFRAKEALEDVFQLRYALGSTDAEQTLAERAALVPALEERHAEARAEVKVAEQTLRDAEGAWETATLAFQAVEAERSAMQAHTERLHRDLGGAALADVSPEALSAAEKALAHATGELTVLERDDRALATEAAVYEERRAQLERAADEAERLLAEEREEARPAAQRWSALREGADRASVLHTVLARHAADGPSARGSGAHLSDAQSKLEVLIDRLSAARGGAPFAAEIAGVAAGEGGVRAEAGTDRRLDVWLRARDWLRCRVPAQIADVAEPLEALERLRDHLTSLEERLSRQESDLRGASEDVARSIEVQLRRSRSQVRRLNQSLDGVRFGGVRGIRVQMRRVERMDQVLRALREGAAQELLFQPNMPIEDALAEIFQRYGGGRGGGARILDYREYVELVVEVQRRTEETWEPVSPTRLSTGEAIGVGAALMMVVLTEWERDANLLRGKREGGSLRFLFLDEANRLSADNLGVLFDLCQTLDLQLLIAAPEVARAEGNTTYRLVRRVAEDGREEVIVSGRRSVASAAQSLPAESEEPSLAVESEEIPPLA